MNKQISNWVAISITLIVIIIATALGGYSFGQQTYEPQIVEIEKAVPKLVVMPVETTFLPHYDGAPLDKSELLALVKSAKAAHQYYIDHPEEQNVWSGNTTFNRLWVGAYTDLEQMLMK